MASGCASCIFGAASTTTLSFPGVVQSIPVFPIITTYSNGSTARVYSTAFYESQGTAITTVYQESEVVWTVTGTVLTYPTQYIQYLAFQGAAVTNPAPASCAESLSVTPLSLPASTDAASFIYPDSVGAAVPLALLNYLDTFGDFIGQLAGDQLTACSPIPTGFTAVPPSGPPQPSTPPATTSVVSSPTSTVSSSASVSPTTNTTTSTSAVFTSTQTLTTSTTVLTSTSTSIVTSSYTTTTTPIAPTTTTLSTTKTTLPRTTTTLPPTTTVVSPTTTTTVSTAVVTTSTTPVVAHTTAYVLSTAEDFTYSSMIPPSFSPSSSSSSPASSLAIPTALPDTLAPPTTTTTTSTTSSPASSVNLGNLLSAFSSLEISEHPTLSTSSSTTSTPSILTTTTMTTTVPPTTLIPGVYTNSTSSYAVGPVTASAPSSPATNATSTLLPFTGAAAPHLRAPQGALRWSECILGLLLSAFLY